MIIYSGVEFRFNRALLNLGSLKLIAEKSGVSLSKISKVLKDDTMRFSTNEAIALGKAFDRTFSRDVEIGTTNSLSGFYVLLDKIRMQKYNPAVTRFYPKTVDSVKSAFLDTLTVYERNQWLKKSYLKDLRELLDAYLES